MLFVGVATGFYYFSPQSQKFAHHRSVREEMLEEARVRIPSPIPDLIHPCRQPSETPASESAKIIIVAQKEAKEAGGRERERERRRAAANNAEAPSVAPRPVPREQLQQLLTGVQHRIATNRSLYEQVRPIPATRFKSYYHS